MYIRRQREKNRRRNHLIDGTWLSYLTPYVPAYVLNAYFVVVLLAEVQD